ncbi:MAG: recombinase family protein [Eubacterium sp.]|nr:recombinase family protein [Eubacterium sp.]
MARTKRKVNYLHPDSLKAEAPAQRIYRAGGYIRLSVEDGGRRGADTAQNQEELIRRYIESQEDMQPAGFYCDNGQTGTSFDRPAFARLMEDAAAGRIDCIVVKDLSRLGRNYLETGKYLEKAFPVLGVRFVSVTDHFDTKAQCSDGFTVPLKNIANEMYSRDISKKVGSVLAQRQRQGAFIGAWAAYGYRKCAHDPHKIEPEEETAPVVQAVFQMRLDGMSSGQIAARLNAQGIPSPSRYHYLKGELTCSRFAGMLWQPQMVRKILSSQVYLGHMVQGRKRASFYEGKKQRTLPASEWVVVEHTHQPLITEEIFQAVQQMAADKRQKAKKERGL